jgi:DNA-binding transcriptional ArsR family regulator
MQDEQTINILKALADPTRLDIVRQLACDKQGTPCARVRDQSPLSQPTMSHHFSKLAEAGVILERKDGKEKIYEVNTSLLRDHGIDVAKL